MDGDGNITPISGEAAVIPKTYDLGDLGIITCNGSNVEFVTECRAGEDGTSTGRWVPTPHCGEFLAAFYLDKEQGVDLK